MRPCVRRRTASEKHISDRDEEAMNAWWFRFILFVVGGSNASASDRPRILVSFAEKNIKGFVNIVITVVEKNITEKNKYKNKTYPKRQKAEQ